MLQNPPLATRHAPLVSVNPAAHPGSPTCGIQEAVDTLPSAGGLVLIPSGSYPVRRSLVLRAGVTLRGEGPATVLVRPAPLVFDLTDPSPAHRVGTALSCVDGLQPGDELWIRDTAQSGWHSRHIVITAIAAQQVKGTLVAGAPERAYSPDAGAWGGNFFPLISVAACRDVTIESLTLDGGEYAYDAGRVPDFTCCAVHGHDVENLCVRRVVVRRWPSDGIGAQGGCATVTECLVEECLGNGLHPGSNIRAGQWTDNISRRNGWDGFYFCLGVRNTVVANNLFLENRRHGIGGLSAPDSYNVITGNVIARNGRRGIEAPQALGNIIANNLIRDNSQTAPGVFPGIWLEEHSGNTVTGNSCLDTQEPHTQWIGIEASNPTGENLIAGNLTPAYSGTPSAPLPRAALRRAAFPPVLDGRLDDAVWQAAARLTLNRGNEDGAPVAVPAEAFVLYDDESLYIGVRCAEPRMDRIRDRVRERGGDCWRENAVEIFIALPSQPDTCFQLAVNSLGAIFENRISGRNHARWDSNARAACQRGSDFWSAEIAIPLATLGLTKIESGQTLEFNVFRSRVTVFPQEVAVWSPTFGAFSLRRRFGTLMST